jgi:mannosyltransferase
MSQSKRKEIFILLLCLLIGFALRYYRLDQKSLWLDEVHTYNDSRDGFTKQMEFYKENPTFVHPPLFFILTHLFYPFSNPERDLRIIPLIVGTLSIPMLYLLARSFSPSIALPCILSLTFMTYHISLSQDGRSYSLLMFLGMAGLYFFMKHLKTSKRRYLFLVAFFFSTLFYTSYSSIPFIVLSQILWFYRPREEVKRPTVSSFLILNGLILLFCLPWILFVTIHYKGQVIMDPTHTEGPGSLWSLLYGVFHDWDPFPPLMIASIALLILLPLFAKQRRNSVVLLVAFLSPVVGLWLYCKWFHVTHFITSRYFITFLPLFLVSLFLSLLAIEFRFERLKGYFRLRFLFLFLFIASNLVILPLYYRYQKQDYRGVVAYLKGHLRDGDRVFTDTEAHMPGLLHYFGVYPKGRHHVANSWKDSQDKTVYKISFVFQNKNITLFSSKTCCSQYVNNGSRLWIVAGKWTAKYIKENSPAVLKGYFDGSFLNFNKFPTDASMYLFLWDPKSPGEKGIDMPIN